jgi:heme exporter protein A
VHQTNDLLEARGLHLWRGDRHVLRGVSLCAASGEAVHVRGPNGAGKTSLLRTVAGFLWPEEGEIRWGGEPVARDRDAFAAATAYLGHDNGLKADLTVRENLHYLIRMRVVAADSAIEGALAELGLSALAHYPVRTLSAGQRRRVAMARVLLSGARLWLLDEPLTNLDRPAAERLSALIGAHVAGGGIALYTAHGELSFGARTRVVELA